VPSVLVGYQGRRSKGLPLAKGYREYRKIWRSAVSKTSVAEDDTVTVCLCAISLSLSLSLSPGCCTKRGCASCRWNRGKCAQDTRERRHRRAREAPEARASRSTGEQPPRARRGCSRGRRSPGYLANDEGSQRDTYAYFPFFRRVIDLAERPRPVQRSVSSADATSRVPVYASRRSSRLSEACRVRSLQRGTLAEADAPANLLSRCASCRTKLSSSLFLLIDPTRSTRRVSRLLLRDSERSRSPAAISIMLLRVIISRHDIIREFRIGNRAFLAVIGWLTSRVPDVNVSACGFAVAREGYELAPLRFALLVGRQWRPAVP